MCQSIPIWLGPWRLRFISLSILLSSSILSISASAPVRQNQQAMSYRIGKTRRITCRVFLKLILLINFLALLPTLNIHPILKTERYCLRHYIDATMPLAPLGNAQQYCSAFNFQLVFRGLFLQFAEPCLRTQTDSLRQQAMRIIKEGKKHRYYCSVSPIRQDIAYSF